MALVMLAALAGYVGYKSWHVSVALEAWGDQPIEGDTSGAAK